MKDLRQQFEEGKTVFTPINMLNLYLTCFNEDEYQQANISELRGIYGSLKDHIDTLEAKNKELIQFVERVSKLNTRISDVSKLQLIKDSNKLLELKSEAQQLMEKINE